MTDSPVRQPLAPGCARTECGLQGLFAIGGRDLLGDAEFERSGCQSLEFLVGAEQDDVDPADHFRDRLVRDVGEVLLAQLVEHEIGGVAEVQELEVVLPDAVDAFEQPVVGTEQRVS